MTPFRRKVLHCVEIGIADVDGIVTTILADRHGDPDGVPTGQAQALRARVENALVHLEGTSRVRQDQETERWRPVQ